MTAAIHRRQFLAASAAAAGGLSLSPAAQTAAPAIAERGVYLNIPSPLHPMTVHDWSEAQWAWYLDALAAERINRLYFYLWQDTHSDFAAAAADRDRNRRLHQRMQRVIGEAQRRGMKATFLFSPTFIPRVLWEKRRELHSDIEYVRAGFPCICPSREGAWLLMRELWTHELEWFRAADGFQLWFYDPGGCMCPACRRDLCGPLVRQVDEFARMVAAKNPKAEFQVSFWPIWAWEDMIRQQYGDALLDRLAKHFGPKRGEVAIVDTADSPRSFLDGAKQRGFRTQAFLFSADVESPFVFLNPQIGYLRETSARMAAKGYSGAFVHSLTPGSKTLATLLAAAAMDRPGDAPETLARCAALRYTGDRAMAERLAPVLLRWERLLADGSPKPAEAKRIASDAADALASLAKSAPQRADAVISSARAIEVLVRAAAESDAGRRQPLAAEFRAVLESSSTFRRFAAAGTAEFPRLVRWVGQGWNKERF